MKLVCETCPHACALEPGQTGLCGARANIDGTVTPINYGRVTALALDPIEKKPLKRFHPGGCILSVGSFGCNMRCPFCQNHGIAAAGTEIDAPYVSPEALVEEAVALTKRPPGNIGIAFTYNEPLIGWEYVRDCARLAHEAGLQNVLVTNGLATNMVLNEILPHIDAMNVDLKSFHPETYKWMGGDLATVKNFIERASRSCHVELTTLILPGKNDSEAEMEEEVRYIASIGPDIPFHITRYFPAHRFRASPTPLETITRLVDIAKHHLKYVYAGNI